MAEENFNTYFNLENMRFKQSQEDTRKDFQENNKIKVIHFGLALNKVIHTANEIEIIMKNVFVP